MRESSAHDPKRPSRYGSPMDSAQLKSFVETRWDSSIVPELERYIAIPNKSPSFDPDWAAHGFMEQATQQIAAWCKEQPIAGLTLEVVRLEGRTPLIFMEIPPFGGADERGTVLLYGHLDKQPEFEGWDADKGPWTPVRIGDKLYGRGGADDGYAAYASLTAIAALQAQGIPHRRCVVVIEACEESGSYDLPHYLTHLDDRVGDVDLVICLDSGAGNYEQLWSTTSLRGNLVGVLSVEVMEPMSDGSPAGVHSGKGTGIIPSSFRILRRLLDRIEDPDTGEILVEELHAAIPPDRVEQAEKAAAILGDEITAQFPLACEPVATGAGAILGQSWKPTLEVTGMGDMPNLQGGNVLRGRTRAKLSFRLAPTADPATCGAAVKRVLEADPPYGARVRFEPERRPAAGWAAPSLAPWLAASLDAASEACFGRPSAFMGEGGSIPFMGMLGEAYPKAQFVITGVLGPESNAHGPNEFLHVPFAKRVTMAVARVLADHASK